MTRVRLLARVFFSRFFESELMPPGLPQVQLVVGVMVLLAAPGLLLPFKLAVKYGQIGETAGLSHVILTDRLTFITLTMNALGLVALATWDGVFPDRRDARILGALPVRGGTQIVARLVALAALAGIFLAGVNVVPTLVYAPLASSFGGAANVFASIVAHLAANATAGLFVFTLLIALQGVALNIFGRRAAQRVAVAMQVLFVGALLQLVFFMDRVGATIPRDFTALAAQPWLRWLPSLWFVGLYDFLAGRGAPGAGAMAAVAIGAAATSTLVAVGIFTSTHGRLLRLAIEGRDTAGPRSRLLASIADRVTAAICPAPVARAAFEFTLRSLARSRSHRLMLSIYVGLAGALVASGLVPVFLVRGATAFAAPGVETLSPPLVLGFWTIVGLRAAIAIPIEPKANWIVRLNEPGDRVTTLHGVRVAFIAIAVTPMTIVAATSAGILWGGWPALVHATVCAVMGLLLVEIVLLRFVKVPFTCPYVPGRSRLRTLWPLYLTGFTTYAYSVARSELVLMDSPRMFGLFVALVAASTGLLALYRRLYTRGQPGWAFDDRDPEEIFQGFQLSEGMAARDRAAPPL